MTESLAMPEQMDIVAEMDREPGTRPVCDELSSTMLKALRSGMTKSGGAAAGLMARRLWCPGKLGGSRFAATPMGAQWRQTLIENERMRRALLRLREGLLNGEDRVDLLDVVAGALG